MWIQSTAEAMWARGGSDPRVALIRAVMEMRAGVALPVKLGGSLY